MFSPVHEKTPLKNECESVPVRHNNLFLPEPMKDRLFKERVF